MELVLKIGSMVPSMLENGKTTKQMDMEFFTILMETNMRVSG